mmetsp:Transcript_48049/g.75939  ORF Transcript_48049/g.75939 Transcript_48049/m.75939 type:complete len:205 (+) Transcript_48049:553-1167(+)
MAEQDFGDIFGACSPDLRRFVVLRLIWRTAAAGEPATHVFATPPSSSAMSWSTSLLEWSSRCSSSRISCSASIVRNSSLDSACAQTASFSNVLALKPTKASAMSETVASAMQAAKFFRDAMFVASFCVASAQTASFSKLLALKPNKASAMSETVASAVQAAKVDRHRNSATSCCVAWSLCKSAANLSSAACMAASASSCERMQP